MGALLVDEVMGVYYVANGSHEVEIGKLFLDRPTDDKVHILDLFALRQDSAVGREHSFCGLHADVYDFTCGQI